MMSRVGESTQIGSYSFIPISFGECECELIKRNYVKLIDALPKEAFTYFDLIGHGIYRCKCLLTFNYFLEKARLYTDSNISWVWGEECFGGENFLDFFLKIDFRIEDFGKLSIENFYMLGGYTQLALILKEITCPFFNISSSSIFEFIKNKIFTNYWEIFAFSRSDIRRELKEGVERALSLNVQYQHCKLNMIHEENTVMQKFKERFGVGKIIRKLRYLSSPTSEKTVSEFCEKINVEKYLPFILKIVLGKN